MVESIRGEQPDKVDRYFYDALLGKLADRQDTTAAFDPRTRGWYQAAMQHTGIITTEPYLFFFLQRPGMTVARQAGNGHAAIGADIKLESLSRTLSRFSLTPGTEAMLYEDGGRAIAYRDENRLRITEDNGDTRIATVAELNVPVLTQLVSDTSATLPPGWLGKVITLPLASDFKPQLAIAVPSDQLLAEAYDSRAQAVVVAIVLIVLVVPMSLVIARGISRPLRNLHTAATELAEGNFDTQLPSVMRRDEVGELNYAFRNMRDRLVEYLDNLQRTTAERQRLQSELNITHDIQMAMVPAGGHARLHVTGWGLYATLLPARSVGGDLYDVIPLSKGRYLLVIGDVSDKGVGAALFMARTVTLAKVLASQTTTPAEFLALLNDQLSQNNDSCMFVTLFCAVINVETGVMQYASAGHNPPLLIKSGNVHWMDVEAASPLGLFAGAEYHNGTAQLEVGDTLIGYTDGITEAFDAEQQEFGEQRLFQLASTLTGEPDVIGEGILSAVQRFCGDTAQSDDITLMVIQRNDSNATITEH